MARPTSVKRIDDELLKAIKEIRDEYDVSEVDASRIIAREFKAGRKVRLNVF